MQPSIAKVSFADFAEVYNYDDKFAVSVTNASMTGQSTVDLQWYSPDVVNVFFGNITTWGPTARNFIFDADFKSKYHYAAVVETHTTGAAAEDLEAQAIAQGFRAYCNHAQPFHATKGSHGGEVILAQEHLYAIPIAQSAQAVANVSNSDTPRYSACEIRVVMTSILLITTYLLSGECWTA